jgi:hypothetical protein
MEAIPSVLARNVRTTHRGAASNRCSPSYRGVSHGECPGVGKPVPESRSSRAIARQHGNSRRSTDASDRGRRIRWGGRAALSTSSPHHKSAMSPRRTTHTLDGASAWRLHRPDFNHAFPAEQRSTEYPSRATVVLTWRNQCGELEPKAHPACAQQTIFPQKYRKTTQRHYGLDTCGVQTCSAKIKKTPQKYRSSHPNRFSKDLMTKPMIPQKSEKRDIAGGLYGKPVMAQKRAAEGHNRVAVFDAIKSGA